MGQRSTIARDEPVSSAGDAVGQVDEARLVAEVLLGDRKAIADFVYHYGDSVFTFLSRRLDDRSSVEDLCQEVFVVAWSKLRSFEGRSSLKTWLCGIAQNKVADFYRRQIRELPLEDEWGEEGMGVADSPAIDVEVDFDRRLKEESIRRTLLELPEGYRAVLRWRYWDEWSLQDIARETGKTVKSIERLLARARVNFAARWKEGQHAEEA